MEIFSSVIKFSHIPKSRLVELKQFYGPATRQTENIASSANEFYSIEYVFDYIIMIVNDRLLAANKKIKKKKIIFNYASHYRYLCRANVNSNYNRTTKTH